MLSSMLAKKKKSEDNVVYRNHSYVVRSRGTQRRLGAVPQVPEADVAGMAHNHTKGVGTNSGPSGFNYNPAAQPTSRVNQFRKYYSDSPGYHKRQEPTTLKSRYAHKTRKNEKRPYYRFPKGSCRPPSHKVMTPAY
jgi:hypothetical protein